MIRPKGSLCVFEQPFKLRASPFICVKGKAWRRWRKNEIWQEEKGGTRGGGGGEFGRERVQRVREARLGGCRLMQT